MTGSQSDGKPVPDPTSLTTDAVERAIKAERDYVDAGLGHLDAMREIQSTQLRELMSKEQAHAVERIKWTKAVRKAISMAVAEKFKSMKIQFDLIERQRVEQKKDTKDAVDAALAAAKEAVKEQTTASGLAQAKSDASFSEQLKQLSTTFTTAINGLTLLLNDTKTRVERLENSRQAGVEQRTDSRLTVGTVLGVVGGFVGVVSLLLAAIVFATR